VPRLIVLPQEADGKPLGPNSRVLFLTAPRNALILFVRQSTDRLTLPHYPIPLIGVCLMPTTEFRCAYCDQPLDLETAKTNEGGQAVHEDCYVAKSVSVEGIDGADRSEAVP
jgi:hypothetical protein